MIIDNNIALKSTSLGTQNTNVLLGKFAEGETKKYEWIGQEEKLNNLDKDNNILLTI